jgi:hypothetical protein
MAEVLVMMRLAMIDPIEIQKVEVRGDGAGQRREDGRGKAVCQNLPDIDGLAT